jgi:magnesium-protoporphyrin O-methyltransferase
MDKMFSRSARKRARKFVRKGLDKPQQYIVQELDRLGIEGRSILEVGCGTGGLHLTLLKKGAASAVGIEVAGGMITEAKRLAAELGLADRTTYIRGDFLTANGSIPTADVVLMDKVLCCYADPRALIERSAIKAKSYVAVSYPRDALFARLAFGSGEKVGKALRWSFHPFYHNPAVLEGLMVEAGLENIASYTTLIWQIRVLRKK